MIPLTHSINLATAPPCTLVSNTAFLPNDSTIASSNNSSSDNSEYNFLVLSNIVFSFLIPLTNLLYKPTFSFFNTNRNGCANSWNAVSSVALLGLIYTTPFSNLPLAFMVESNLHSMPNFLLNLSNKFVNTSLDSTTLCFSVWI